LLVIDDESVLRLVVQAVGTYRGQHLALRGQPEQLVARLHEYLVADARVVLKEEVEAGGVTQGHHRRRCEGHDLCVTETGEKLLGPPHQVEHAHAVLAALVPGLETNEGDGRILPATGKAETGNSEHRLHDVTLFGLQLLAHRIYGLPGPLHGRACRAQDRNEHRSLILTRQEGGRQLAEQHHHAADNDRIQQQIGSLAPQYGGYAMLVAVDPALEGTVEP